MREQKASPFAFSEGELARSRVQFPAGKCESSRSGTSGQRSLEPQHQRRFTFPFLSLSLSLSLSSLLSAVLLARSRSKRGTKREKNKEGRTLSFGMRRHSFGKPDKCNVSCEGERKVAFAPRKEPSKSKERNEAHFFDPTNFLPLSRGCFRPSQGGAPVSVTRASLRPISE